MRHFMRAASLLLPTSIGAIGLQGCANLNSINHHFSVPENDGGRADVITVDARQRAILATNSGTDGNPAWRFCSEPSPDVFAVISAALSGGANFGQGAGAAPDLKVAAQIAASLSESGASISRTQTVNLIREAMFRTCERMMNGKMSNEEMTIQSARDFRVMVAVLAIEQLTGAVTPPSVTLKADGSAAVMGSGEVIRRLDDALKVSLEAKDAAAKATSKAEGMEPTATSCEKIDPDTKIEAELAKKAACEEADQRKALAKTAADHYADLKSALDKSNGVDSLEAKASASPAFQVGAWQANPVAQANVAIAVANIVDMAFNFDEVEAMCIRSVADQSIDKKTKDTCNLYFQTKAIGASYANLTGLPSDAAAEIMQQFGLVASESKKLFDEFNARGLLPADSRLNACFQKRDTAYRAELIRAAGDIKKLEVAFNKMPLKMKQCLAGH